MKRLIISILILSSGLLIFAQTRLTIEGQTFTNSDETWLGVEIPRNTPTTFFFRNNSISSKNRYGYLLQAGDEKPDPDNNNLDGSIITGNRLTWTGTDMVAIPHGIFTGHNKDVSILYNYLDHVPMGIIRKSSTNMGNSGGGIAYNIVRGGAVGIVVKGMSNVNIINNTLYSDRTPSQTWRPLLHIYTNTDFGGYSVSHGTKIYNNIFYTKYRTFVITVQDAESLKDLECDYNIYWSDAGSPLFNVGGTEKSFAQWQAMGYDKHSVILNPGFGNLVSFVPSKRLDFGINLGDNWNTGLSSDAAWRTGTDPEKSVQNGVWQAGAVIHSESAVIPSTDPVYTSAFFMEQNPDVIEVNFNSINPEIVPATSAFEVMVNSVPAEVVSLTISQNTVYLKLSQPVKPEDNVTVSYKLPGQYPLQNFSGGLVSSFPHQRVIRMEGGDVSGSNIKIYPNPAGTFINVTNLQPVLDTYIIRIYDLGGRLHKEIRLDPDYDIHIPLDLSPGMYIVRVILGKNTLYVKKIVIIR